MEVVAYVHAVIYSGHIRGVNIDTLIFNSTQIHS